MTDWTPTGSGPDAPGLHALLERARVEGALLPIGVGDERSLSPLAFLARAMARLPALALVLPEVAARGEDYEPSLTRDVWALTAGVVRFTVRALEVHARDCGYAPEKWRAAGLRRAELALEDAHDTLGDRLGASVRTLAEAIVASEGDVIALPEALADALAAALALYASLPGM